MFDDDNTQVDSFTINAKFARNYEQKKRHEELSELSKKFANASDDEDSDEDVVEDENGALVTPELDAQIMKTIAKIRAGDPTVYDSSRNFFSEEQIEAARREWKQKQEEAKKTGKPMKLKDFHRRNLLEGNASESDDEDADGATPAPSFRQEQEMIKEEFRQVARMVDDDDDFLQLKAKSEAEKAKEDEAYKEFLLSNMDQEAQAVLNAKRNTMNENPDDAFLLNYILNRGWVDPNADSGATPNLSDVSDTEELEAAEEFEYRHNFRFEEEGAAEVVTHSRSIPGTIRREDDARKKKREAKKARKEAEKLREEEEYKRLRSLKKQEIQQRLERIKEIAGGSLGVEIDLDGDFDPEKFDQQMQKAFNEEYYEQEDEQFDTRDDDVSNVIEEDLEADDDFAAYEEDLNGTMYVDDGDDSYPPVKLDERAKEELSKEAQEIKSKLSTLPTSSRRPFAYRQVVPETFGLTPLEILEADDADLNSLVGLKKLAPFRKKEAVDKDMQRWKKKGKKKLKEFRKALREKMASTDQEAASHNQSNSEGKKIGGKKRKQAGGDEQVHRKRGRNELTTERLQSYQM
ncbi:KRRI-Interacting protein 1 [Gaertneriomyces sp. JEL0708]|nr:KRRI-Interacting protein 1 [Gaertneriomyces sp. JEL0708]